MTLDLDALDKQHIVPTMAAWLTLASFSLSEAEDLVEGLRADLTSAEAERDAALARAVPDGWKAKWNISVMLLARPLTEGEASDA